MMILMKFDGKYAIFVVINRINKVDDNNFIP